MKKIEKVFSLIIAGIFLLQNQAFCNLENNFALRPPLQFGESIKESKLPEQWKAGDIVRERRTGITHKVFGNVQIAGAGRVVIIGDRRYSLERADGIFEFVREKEAPQKKTKTENLNKNPKNSVEPFGGGLLSAVPYNVGASKIEWAQMRDNWGKKYRDARSRLQNAQELNVKFAIIREINKDMTDEEIRNIQKIESDEDDLNNPSPYPKIEPSRVPWDKNLKANVESELKTRDVDRYYYHGTSLGIAIVSGVRGFLGGFPSLSRRHIDVDDMINDKEFIFLSERTKDIDYYDFGRILIQTTDYADRTIRPARAVLAYLAFRAAWEAERRKERFPPLDYFFQRAVIRIPKEDAHGVSGNNFWQQLATDEPVSLQHADILLDKDISLPKHPYLLDFDPLVVHDPENLNPGSDAFFTLPKADKDRIAGLMRNNANIEIKVIPCLESIGNIVWTKWQPLFPSNPDISQRRELRSKL